jgi:3'-phosphoadenosine 5'-phosphosulfate sulfotransferase (PAPS reductase)/FAD synthetase
MIIKTNFKILVPVSGGKDSTASLILALNNNPMENIIPVFNDTGWEHPLTYEYLKYLEGRLNIKINRTLGNVTGKYKGLDLPNLIRKMGKFPFGRGRFCTMYLKQYALRDWYKENLFDRETIYEFWFGMRTQESGQRSRKYNGMNGLDLYDVDDVFPKRYNKKMQATIKVRLPIVDWTEDEVFNFLKENKVNKNKLYDEGTNDRVGCYPCMLAGKKVQERMLKTEFGQERLKVIQELEKEIGKKYEMFDTDQGSCEICKM